MTGTALLSEASAWIGGSFDGEHCERCGSSGKLDIFRIEVQFGMRNIVREAKLCRKCMQRAELEISRLPQDKWNQ